MWWSFLWEFTYKRKVESTAHWESEHMKWAGWMGVGQRSRPMPQPKCRLCISYVCGQHLTIQPGHWGTLETCPSHIAQSTLWLLLSIAPATSNRAQLHLDQQNMTWQQPVILPVVRSLDYFGFSDWVAAPLKKYLRQKTHLTGDVMWPPSSSQQITLE